MNPFLYFRPKITPNIMQETTTDQKKLILPIFLTVFIDMLGVGIIIPVLPALFFNQETAFFSPDTSQDFRSVMYGLLIASYPFMQFFGAPALGALSDRYGRKPILIISLLGTMIGYVLFAGAIYSGNLLLLFISRMLPGFTGGNISIILSAIADVSDEESRTRNFGLVGMAFGFGFIMGPFIGGVLADNSVVSWFDHATPFWFTAILTLVNIALVQFNFRETLAQRRQSRVSLFTGFRNIALSFQLPQLRVIFSVVLLFSLGFTFFTQFFAVYLIQKFHFQEFDTGKLYGWIGVWLAITQGVTVRWLSRRYSGRQILPISILGLGASLALLLLPQHAAWFFLINPLIATFQGITSPNLTSMVSKQAGNERQGEILGINQSMHSLGQIIPPLVAGYINTIDARLPLLAAAILTTVAWLVFVVLFKEKSK